MIGTQKYEHMLLVLVAFEFDCILLVLQYKVSQGTAMALVSVVGPYQSGTVKVDERGFKKSRFNGIRFDEVYSCYNDMIAATWL
jgi:hypothetical protein